MYYCLDIDNCQYQYFFDFCFIYDVDKGEIIVIDIFKVCCFFSKVLFMDYYFVVVEVCGGYCIDLKFINIIQFEGVLFKFIGREIEW